MPSLLVMGVVIPRVVRAGVAWLPMPVEDDRSPYRGVVEETQVLLRVVVLWTGVYTPNDVSRRMLS